MEGDVEEEEQNDKPEMELEINSDGPCMYMSL